MVGSIGQHRVCTDSVGAAVISTGGEINRLLLDRGQSAVLLQLFIKNKDEDSKQVPAALFTNINPIRGGT